MSDPYTAYVSWKHRRTQQYDCWREDRMAAGNGVDALSPFLDHRIVELVAAIPVHRKASLLNDNRILRTAMRGLLPEEVVVRAKAPFFPGNGRGSAHRMVVRMLSQDGNALLEQALAAAGARDFLRPDALRRMLGRLQTEAEPTDAEFLLRLVNLGLLDSMARTRPTRPIDTPRVEIRSAPPARDWAHDTELGVLHPAVDGQGSPA